MLLSNQKKTVKYKNTPKRETQQIRQTDINKYRATAHLIFNIIKKSEFYFLNISQNYLGLGCLIWKCLHFKT